MAEKLLKTEGKVVLPPWGNNPPARPLSPKRRPRASAIPTKSKSLWQRTSQSTSFKVACLFAVVGALILQLCLNTVVLPKGEVGYRSTPDASANVPGSDRQPHANVSDPWQVDTSPADIQMPSRDVFILANVSHPHQLENYSADATFRGAKGIFRGARGGNFRDSASAQRVLMGRVKLEEVGTAWSQAERPAAASMFSVKFRPSATTDNEAERPLIWKLQWRAVHTEEERPLTYKLQWWPGEHIVSAPRAYELRWRK